MIDIDGKTSRLPSFTCHLINERSGNENTKKRTNRVDVSTASQLSNPSLYAEVPMNIPVRYEVRRGSTSHVLFWRVTSILFMSLSLFLGFVAMHNAKPIQCDDIVYNNNVKVCEVIIKGGQ